MMPCHVLPCIAMPLNVLQCLKSAFWQYPAKDFINTITDSKESFMIFPWGYKRFACNVICCNALKCPETLCNALQCLAIPCKGCPYVLKDSNECSLRLHWNFKGCPCKPCNAMPCNVLHCFEHIAMLANALQYLANGFPWDSEWCPCNALQCPTMPYNVLQCLAMSCNAPQCLNMLCNA